jgi:glucans biosynthesis protein
MHGGARGCGGPPGERNGNFRHGHFTTESVAERKAVRAVIRQAKKMLGEVG